MVVVETARTEDPPADTDEALEDGLELEGDEDEEAREGLLEDLAVAVEVDENWRARTTLCGTFSLVIRFL